MSHKATVDAKLKNAALFEAAAKAAGGTYDGVQQKVNLGYSNYADGHTFIFGSRKVVVTADGTLVFDAMYRDYANRLEDRYLVEVAKAQAAEAGAQCIESVDAQGNIVVELVGGPY